MTNSRCSWACPWDGAHQTTLHLHSPGKNTRLHSSRVWRITNNQCCSASPTPSYSVQLRQETSQCMWLEGSSLDSIPTQPLSPRAQCFPPLRGLLSCRTAWGVCPLPAGLLKGPSTWVSAACASAPRPKCFQHREMSKANMPNFSQTVARRINPQSSTAHRLPHPGQPFQCSWTPDKILKGQQGQCWWSWNNDSRTWCQNHTASQMLG